MAPKQQHHPGLSIPFFLSCVGRIDCHPVARESTYSSESRGSICLSPWGRKTPHFNQKKGDPGTIPIWKLPLMQEAHLLLCGHSNKSHHTAMRQMSPSKGASHTSVHNSTCHGLPSPEPASPSFAHPQPSLWLLTACLPQEAVSPAYIVPWEWTRCLPKAQAEGVPRKSEVPFAPALTPPHLALQEAST